VSGVAAWDADRTRLAIVLVNFRDRYALRRHVQLQIEPLPPALAGGEWREWTIDATHSNVWHDPAKAELTKTRTQSLDEKNFAVETTLMPNSVTLVELVRK
jgi:hypothetical protein